MYKDTEPRNCPGQIFSEPLTLERHKAPHLQTRLFFSSFVVMNRVSNRWPSFSSFTSRKYVPLGIILVNRSQTLTCHTHARTTWRSQKVRKGREWSVAFLFHSSLPLPQSSCLFHQCSSWNSVTPLPTQLRLRIWLEIRRKEGRTLPNR